MISKITIAASISVATLIFCTDAASGNEVTRFVDALEQGDAAVLRELESGVIGYLNELADVSPERRAQEVSSLARALLDPETQRFPAGGPAEQSIARVLCRMEPYSMPDEKGLSRLQSEFLDRFETQWSVYASDPSENEDAYTSARFLDCAAFNPVGSYFDVVSSALRVSPAGSCANRTYLSTSEIENLAEAMRGVAADTATAGSSYYRIRAALVRANVDVALTLSRARDPELAFLFNEVQSEIASVGRRLGQLLDGNSIVMARNGWRFHNDVTYYAALYSLVGSEDPATQIELLTQLAERPAVSLDPALVDIVEPWVLGRITASEPEYVDPVLVDRLFPGLLSDPAADCSRNRRQSIEAIDLADGTLSCWQDTGERLSSLDDLRNLDLCLNQIESEVWWIQLGAYRNESTADDAAVRFRNELAGATDVEFVPEILGPDTTSSFYRLRTVPTLTRREAGLLSEAAHENGWETLIGRQTIW